MKRCKSYRAWACLVVTFFTASACSTGVQSNVTAGKVTVSIQSAQSVDVQRTCLDENLARLPFRYEIETKNDGWETNIYVFGGPAVGWFQKARVVRTGNKIDYYMDAADLGFDAFGVRSAVWPVVEECA